MLDRTTGYTNSQELLDLSKPSLQALSHILRNRELWPTDFEWHYWDCNYCALGLANALWYQTIGNYGTSTYVGEVLGLKRNEINLIFFGYGWATDGMTITPEMVADKIDQLPLEGE